MFIKFYQVIRTFARDRIKITVHVGTLGIVKKSVLSLRNLNCFGFSLLFRHNSLTMVC
jgi:hypothetical protein